MNREREEQGKNKRAILDVNFVYTPNLGEEWLK
jgi:hypothetical protein